MSILDNDSPIMAQLKDHISSRNRSFVIHSFTGHKYNNLEIYELKFVKSYEIHMLQFLTRN